jgi:hypothetical protein
MIIVENQLCHFFDSSVETLQVCRLKVRYSLIGLLLLLLLLLKMECVCDGTA